MKQRVPLRRALTLLVLLPAQVAGQSTHASKPMASPTDADRASPASVSIADYRYGDILWENDLTAHRIYARPLEVVEPPSGSGVDAWGKGVRWRFADRQLRTGDQHENHGEGLDFYDVGTGRGMGGIGIWQDNKLWTSRNYARAHILRNGPDAADFRVNYAPWPVDLGRKVWETRRFTLPNGTHFTRMISTLSSDKAAPFVVGIGISRRATDARREGAFVADRATGRFAWWGEAADPAKGAMGIALMIDPATIVGVVRTADDQLVLVRAMPGKPFVYYAGAAWSRGTDRIHDRAAWQAYVAAQKPDFRLPN